MDFAAFNNLLDTSQEQFLKQRLSPDDYRRIRRARLLATLEYVKRLAHNAHVLMRLGEAARSSSEPEVAQAAQTLVNNALRMRLLAMSAIVKLYGELWVPQISTQLEPVADRYRQLTEAAGLLARCATASVCGKSGGNVVRAVVSG